MDYIDATIEMKIKADGNPKFEIVLPQIVEWTCYIDTLCKNGVITQKQYERATF